MHYTSREVYEFISKQTSDPIVERKTCAISGQPFAIFQSDLDFYAKISPTFNGQKFPISTPTLCPEERQRRRLSFRNERKLYRRQCDASKKSIISIYSPDKPYKVYDQKIRRSDNRDPMDYGMDFDFSKTFTENFKKLMIKVPTMNLFVTPDAEENNCQYVNSAGFNKDCYFIFDSDQNEHCLYSTGIKDSKNCIDVLVSMKCEYSYEMIYCVGCYNCKYCFFSTLCTNCIGCRSCVSCSDCFGCYGMKNKKYCIYNKQYTKEEYEKILPTLIHNNYQSHGNDYILPDTHNMIQTCEDIIGSSLAYCKNTRFCFDCSALQDSKYSDGIMNGTSDLYDHSSFGEQSQRTLECEGTGRRVNNILFGRNIFLDSRDILYSRTCCQGSHNLFGCIGLRNKSYCIFNKQYTKEEYEIQVAKIIAHMQTTGEWGDFFHPSLSPFGYNETVAQEYFPIQQGELQQFGYHQSIYNSDPSLPEGVQTLSRKNYSDEKWNDLLSQDNLETQVFLCSVSGRPYRLQKAEIEFYRKHHLPIPDKHPDIRHEERMKLRPGRTLFLRNCDCCNKEMLSVYPQDHKGKVYCESCYQQEVYS